MRSVSTICPIALLSTVRYSTRLAHITRNSTRNFTGMLLEHIFISPVSVIAWKMAKLDGTMYKKLSKAVVPLLFFMKLS